jgi:hypothetical protein
MRKVLLAVILSLLVSSQLVAAPRKPPRRPSTRGVSPISRFWAEIGSYLKGHRLSGDGHSLPPPPSTLLSGG